MHGIDPVATIHHQLRHRNLEADFEEVYRVLMSPGTNKGTRRIPTDNSILWLLNAHTLPVGTTITSDTNILIIQDHDIVDNTRHGINMHEFQGNVVIELPAYGGNSEDEQEAYERVITTVMFYKVIYKI